MPFLKIGRTSAIFQDFGILPSLRVLLKSNLRGRDNTLDSSLRTLGWTESGPGDLSGFNLFSTFSTSSSVKSMLDRFVWKSVSKSGIGSEPSSTKTEEKKSLRTSHFSVSEVVKISLLSIRLAIPSLGFVLEAM